MLLRTDRCDPEVFSMPALPLSHPFLPGRDLPHVQNADRSTAGAFWQPEVAAGSREGQAESRTEPGGSGWPLTLLFLLGNVL